MKILAIGDIHGRNIWKDADFDAFDKIVFVGDYVDSYDKSDWETYSNLKEILEKKEKYGGKVVLLVGNHDIQYIFYPDYRCSGFRENAQWDLTTLYNDHKKDFQVAFQVENYLFTHAGVTRKWYQDNFEYFKNSSVTLADTLNEMYEYNKERKILFQCSQLRGGYDLTSGIVWADKRETENDFLFGFHQIVGHTRVPDFLTINLEGLDSSITYVDVLEFKEAFYEITV